MGFLVGRAAAFEIVLIAPAEYGRAPMAPVMKGTVAYCSQLTWVNANSTRVSQGQH